LRGFTQCDSIKPNIYNPQALNCYSYVLNNPYKYTDSSGNYVETAIDVGFILYDINELNKEQSLTNYLALGADVAGAALPGFTGGRQDFKFIKIENFISKLHLTVI